MDARRIAELLSELVSIPSINPGKGPLERPDQGEKRMAEYVVGWFRANQIDAEIDEYLPGRFNVVAKIEKDRSWPTVLLEAHTDTVDIHWPDGKRFRPSVREGRLYGLGACDDKGSLCAQMLAVLELAQFGRLRKNVVLAATGDEEYGFTGVRRALARGVHAAGAIIGEPTRLRIVRRHKAIFRWLVKFHGKSAHSSTPHLGDNAVYKACRAVAELERLAQETALRPGTELLTAPTLSVGVIRGGQQVNSVPDLCEIQVDRRLLPEEDPAKVDAEIRAAVARALPSPADWSMEVLLTDLCLNTAPNAWIVGAAEAACRRVLGSAEIIGASYGTDASKTAEAGIPSIVFGPGDPAFAHTPQEHIALNDIEKAIAVLVELLGR